MSSESGDLPGGYVTFPRRLSFLVVGGLLASVLGGAVTLGVLLATVSQTTKQAQEAAIKVAALELALTTKADAAKLEPVSFQLVAVQAELKAISKQIDELGRRLPPAR